MTASPAAAPAPASLSGQLVTLVGGGGFVGRSAAQALMRAGARVRIVQRHPRRAFAVKALGNLGQVQFAAADAADPAATARAIAGSDVVVNLVAVLKGDFTRANVDTARTVAEAAAAAGVRALVHVSAIGADAASPSAYGRSKAAGEAAVRAAFPAATILRPSIIFGREDQFVNRFAGLISMMPVVPVFAPATKFQPIFVGDVADAIAAAAAAPLAHAGKTYELGGPQQISMHGLMTWISRQIGRHPMLVDVPDTLAGVFARATGWLPGAPITADQWAMLGRDNVVADGAEGLAALGVAATPLDAAADGWLTVYRRHGRFTARTA